jgi:hypothetical protein
MQGKVAYGKVHLELALIPQLCQHLASCMRVCVCVCVCVCVSVTMCSFDLNSH